MSILTLAEDTQNMADKLIKMFEKDEISEEEYDTIIEKIDDLNRCINKLM